MLRRLYVYFSRELVRRLLCVFYIPRHGKKKNLSLCFFFNTQQRQPALPAFSPTK
jgi:hypothetical protein